MDNGIKDKFIDLVNDPDVLTEGRRNNDTMNLMIMSYMLGFDWGYPLMYLDDPNKADAYVEFATENNNLRIRYVEDYAKDGILEDKLIQ